jgi:hypothetical protein
MLKTYVEFTHLLIGAEGAKTPAGVADTGDPAGVSDEEAPGKRSAWSANQQTSLNELIRIQGAYRLIF